MEFHKFDKITAIDNSNWDVLEKYTFYLNNFDKYHRTPDFRETVKKFNQFSTYNLADDYYDSTARDVLFELLNTKVCYRKVPIYDNNNNNEVQSKTSKTFDHIDFPENFTDLDKAILFRIAADNNSDLYYTNTDVKVLARLLLKNQKKMDNMSNKRVQAFCKFIIKAAEKDCALFGWKKIS